jgi:branched-chain amino acid transport system permease protein
MERLLSIFPSETKPLKRNSIMTLTNFIHYFINGIVMGSLYVLMAIGLSVIFGMIGIINFAHGVIYAVGAYAMVLVTQQLGYWPAFVISPILVGLLGMVIEASFLRRIYVGDPLRGLLFTFGLAMVLEQLIRIIWGPSGFPYLMPGYFSGTMKSMTSLGIEFSRYRIFIFACAVGVIFGLWWFIEKTPYGVIIRAGSRDPEMVRILGISLKPIMTMVFGLGAALAGFAGVLAAPLAGVQPSMGDNVGNIAFVVVVIGGLGSFWGAVLSGLLVGEVENLSILIWPPIAQSAMYILMAVILLLRPRGLFGEKWERFE